MKKSEVLKIAKADLKAAEPLRKELDSKIEVWKREYNGEPYGNERKNRSAIVSRDIKKQSEWQHASLIDPFVSNATIISASPVTAEDAESAQSNEIVLNTQFCRLFNRYSFMTKFVKVLDQEGTAIIMTGWDYKDEVQEVEVPIIQLDPMTGQEVVVGTTLEQQTVILKNQPTAKVVRNEDVFVDPTCQDDIDNAQFFIYRFETDLSTLKADGRYKNLDKIGEREGGDIDYDSEDETEFQFSDDARKKLVVYEYWGNIDVNDDGIVEPIVIAWVGDTIIRFSDNPYPDKKPPFIVVPFNSVPFQLHGEANAELISDNQKVKTAILRGFIDNMALSNNGQKGVRVGALNALNRKRFLNGEHFEYNGSKEDFYDGSFNNIPTSAFNVYSLMDNDIESTTGIKNFNSGITGASLGATATAARGALDATSTRRLNLVRNISENAIKPLMRKWKAYNSEFLEDEQVFRMTNKEYRVIKRDDLEGRIDIDIAVSTAEDNAVKAQELAFMLQTIGPNEDPAIRKEIMAEIVELYKMPHLAEKLRNYQPQPDPMQQQMQQLQLQLLEAQVLNERAKGQENMVDVQLKTAKTQNELAKAGKVTSEKDIKDLEFLERESGLDHIKEMDKISAKKPPQGLSYGL